MTGDMEQLETVIIGGGHAGLTMLIISVNLGEHLIPLRAELVNVGVGTGSEDFSGSRR
jgi:hypothetical protein